MCLLIFYQKSGGVAQGGDGKQQPANHLFITGLDLGFI
jgi:hypothetical protein